MSDEKLRTSEANPEECRAHMGLPYYVYANGPLKGRCVDCNPATTPSLKADAIELRTADAPTSDEALARDWLEKLGFTDDGGEPVAYTVQSLAALLATMRAEAAADVAIDEESPIRTVARGRSSEASPCCECGECRRLRAAADTNHKRSDLCYGCYADHPDHPTDRHTRAAGCRYHEPPRPASPSLIGRPVGSPDVPALTDEQVEHALYLAERATDVLSYASDDITPGDFEKSLTKDGPGPVWFCWCGTKTDPLFVAITGNGPTSEHNAAFIACAKNVVTMLGREVQRLRRASAPRVEPGQTRSTANGDETIGILGCYGAGSGGLLFSVTLPNTSLRSQSGLSEEDIALRYPVVKVEPPRSSKASPEAEVAPVPMFLTCPKCNARHIDEGDFATKRHHTHSCQSCGLTWRPAVIATVGVAFLPGFKNDAPCPEGAQIEAGLAALDDANHDEVVRLTTDTPNAGKGGAE